MTGRTPPRKMSVKLPVAIGSVGPNSDVEICIDLCVERIRRYGQQQVLVAPNGRVYLVPANDVRACSLVDINPAWSAGIFGALVKIHGKIVHRLSRTDLHEAIMATYDALNVPVRSAESRRLRAMP